MSNALMRELLESGAHFGHRTDRWNPKMAPYIHMSKNGIHIINLKETIKTLHKACRFVYDIAKDGGEILFVGSKKQAKAIIREESLKSSSPFVSERWLGGTLTNYETIRKSVSKLHNIQKMTEDGTLELRTKKEILKLKKLEKKLHRNLEGIQNVDKIPSCIVIVDIRKEQIAVNEAKILNIPIIGCVDTNADPDQVDICIPINDDARKATEIVMQALSDAVIKGKALYQEKLDQEEAEALEKKKQEELLKKEEEKKRQQKIALQKERELGKQRAMEIARENRKKEAALAKDAEEKQKSASASASVEEAGETKKAQIQKTKNSEKSETSAVVQKAKKSESKKISDSQKTTSKKESVSQEKDNVLKKTATKKTSSEEKTSGKESSEKTKSGNETKKESPEKTKLVNETKKESSEKIKSSDEAKKESSEQTESVDETKKD